MSRLELQVNDRDDVAVADLKGDLVFGTECEELSRALAGIVDQGKKRLLLNLAHLQYIDSSGVGELVVNISAIKNANGELKLAAPNKMVGKVLQLVQLHKMVEIYPTVEEALASFGE